MKAAAARGGSARRRGRKPGDGSQVLPLYHRIYMLLAEQLREGRFPLGEALPSELQLADRYGVSRVTIRRTLDRLERERLIRRRRGSGTYPVAPRREAQPARADIGGMLANLITMTKETAATTLWSGETLQPDWVQTSGLVPTGSRLFKIVRRRDMGDEPFSVTSLLLPRELAELVDMDALGNEPVMVALEREGVSPTTAEQVLTVALADAEVAAQLGVDVGAPLICMRRAVLDPKGAAILFQESVYPPDRYEYRMTLSRVTAGIAPRWTPVA
ncbi:MAG: GntR family transcriptional regulator [Pseudomonadota bacterium]